MKEYDYSKLLGRIKEKCNSNAIFAVQMGISERTLCLKLNNKVDFRQKEISKACDILKIANDEICYYFFKIKTQ